ncbi:MAG: succinate dehydrogenase assembly factor 2 [Hyphomonadaceae bacterium]|nr:succinate dehydrogenase assembly factor 2 [Hyphomonadaceae bacterium]
MDETRKKKLFYRANYRGFKEVECLLGGFLKAHMDDLGEDELIQFEDLLRAKDHDIYAWITGIQDVPADYNTPVFGKIRAYRPTV